MNTRKLFAALLISSMLFTTLIAQKSQASSGTYTPAVNITATPIAEAEVISTAETRWGWYFNVTAAWINENGKKSNLRPFKLVPNGAIEYEPRYHVLFVRNDGVYKVDDWQVVIRTMDNLSKLDQPAFRLTGWRVTNIALHEIKDKINQKEVTAKRAATIIINDPLYAAYELRGWQNFEQLKALGNQYRVVDLDRFYTNGAAYYSAVIVPNTGQNRKNWAWLFNQTKDQILEKAKDINDKKFRVTDLERREDGRYDALLVESKGEVEKWYTNQTDETMKNDLLRRHGSYSGGDLHGGARFIALVPYKDANNSTKYDVLTMENGDGQYPVDRDNVKGFEEIDKAFIHTMSRHGIPGANFALEKEGKVIYRAAYGYADLKTSQPATRNNRGRIASISKTITAAAIMKLAYEQKDFSLDSPVFGNNGVLSSLKPFSYKGYQGVDAPNLDKITVRHLLTHSAGWDRGRSGDPNAPKDDDPYTCDGSRECEPTIALSQRIAQIAKADGSLSQSATRGANAEEVIRYMMKPDDKDYLPAWKPGEKQVYSNFGFTVLQKIVEVRSGMPYFAYVQKMASQMGVLFYAGSSDPKLAVPGEWTYHDVPGAGLTTSVYWNSNKLDTPVPASYVYDMNTMLGHGGWVTSPTDLVKFVSKLDSTAPNPWIPFDVFKSMMNRPAQVTDPTDFKYTGLCWSVDNKGDLKDDKFIFEHGGALTGASSLTLKGWSYRKAAMAFLFNFRADEAAGEIKNAVEPIIAAKDDEGILAGLAK